MPAPIQTSPLIDIDLPVEVEKLFDLAYNLWWVWSPEAQALFSSIDAESWSRYANPLEVLTSLDRARWETLLANETFMAAYHEVTRSLEAYLAGGGESWFARTFPDYAAGPVAYFSMEYGLHECLPLYSGGLGVLSGDHCKSASDLGLPFVAVGLLYRHGYFRQTVDADGFQQHYYPELDFARLPVRPVVRRTGQDLIVEVPLPGRELSVKVWVAFVGRVPLLLLDTDISANDPADRAITSGLYVRGREMRLAQELVIGVGGVKALDAVGVEPAVWHANEGHSVLLQLERLRRHIESTDTTFDEARAQLRRSVAFTTHTPVAAGHEQFASEVAEKYLAAWTSRLSVSLDRLIALGHADHGESDQPFNLTAMALRTSAFVNGVSRLNAEVSNGMWRHLVAREPLAGNVVYGITNGVHFPTWIGPELRSLLGRALGHGWDDGEEVPWGEVRGIADAELWAAHQSQKQRLARFTRARSLVQLARHGRSPDVLRQVASLFDPQVLTLGFARRFATYKRADLFFRDLHRLRSLLCHPERPVQIVVAGKAHPADRPAQELIQHIFNLSQEQDLLGRVFFIENYDMQVGRMLVQGVDVWLNTPRRPFEASGTSGQKAAVNGVLNCSILDGWWPEGYNGKNGWAIGGTESLAEEWRQDQEDGRSLYETLEEQIVPRFYERDDGGLPRAWIAMMKESIATIGAAFSSSRMVREYAERVYVPLGRGQG
jgi:starch phosphorylase